ncbi:hypothetical protein GCM10010869_00980 [Mesorhizobium tianshanense]|uniref:hypothetical protein n=1 Tax=Mesorhizobium tianshanense TaxID=39844 RepID=UPI00119E7BA2|nr:hypothetical protein [Mesorhizobium tianshanense]GLS34510.1 hypothetical protein GCM10010869_00980 [Mesorhizobium tianshanense]
MAILSSFEIAYVMGKKTPPQQTGLDGVGARSLAKTCAIGPACATDAMTGAGALATQDRRSADLGDGANCLG